MSLPPELIEQATDRWDARTATLLAGCDQCWGTRTLHLCAYHEGYADALTDAEART